MLWSPSLPPFNPLKTIHPNTHPHHTYNHNNAARSITTNAVPRSTHPPIAAANSSMSQLIANHASQLAPAGGRRMQQLHRAAVACPVKHSSTVTQSLRAGCCRPPKAVQQHGSAPTQPQQPLQQRIAASSSAFAGSFALYLLAAAPAGADVADVAGGATPFQGVTANSLYVTLALFLMTAPGIWSQVKRAPTAVRKRLTYEVPGPAAAGSMPLDARARQIFSYFKKYNYQLKETGDVIVFEGIYAPDRGQAAAVTFYTFVGMGSVALVLSILVPSVGNWWYALTLLSPAAWWYYFQKGERTEQVRVKMVTADDDSVTDIIVEGDREELERMSKELQLTEKGKVRVKGILEA